MSAKETGPFGKAKQTSHLDEGVINPPEAALNKIILRYVEAGRSQGRGLTIPAPTEEINTILSQYCDMAYEKPSIEELQRLRLTVRTLLEAEIQKNNEKGAYEA